MGYYTEFVFACELKDNVPEDVVQILKFIILDESTGESVPLPDHELFATDRWHCIGLCSSYYFAFTEPCSNLVYDEISKSWKVVIRSSLKNYCNEIEKFVDWLKPYIERGSGRNRNFLGYWMNEDGEEPTLIWLDK